MHKKSDEVGAIRLPKIAPHLRINFIPFDGADKRILVVTSHYDQRHCEVYPATDFGEMVLSAIDGRTTDAQLIERFTASGRSPMEVSALLKILAKADILISGEYDMEDGKAAWWLNAGFTPALIEEVLHRTRIAVINHAQSPHCESALRAMLNDVGVCVEADDDSAAALTVVVVDDYLQESLGEINRDYLRTQRAWLLVQLSGMVHWAGPAFNQSAATPVPDKPYLATDFCWQCLAQRIEHNRQIEQATYRQTGIKPAVAPTMHSAALHASAHRIALEIAKCLVHTEVEANPAASGFASSAWVSDQIADQTGWHRVNKNPACAVCGETREPAAVALDDAETGTRYVGSGWRICPPERTYAEYRHLNNAYTGIVDSLEDLQNPIDDACFVSESGSNIATKSDSVMFAMLSVRMRNAGKGTSQSAARTGALCETIERYSASLHGDEMIRRARYRDFPTGDALMPNRFMNFSDAQFAQRARENQSASGNALVNIPAPLAEDEPCEWSPIWSVAQQRAVWTPSQSLYFGCSYKEQWIAVPDSNGVAAGNTKTEAFVQAFLEVLERDAISIWWYNKLRCDGVALESIDIPFVQQVVGKLKQHNRRCWILDLSLDFDVAIFAFLSCAEDSSGDGKNICMGFSAHFDPEIALTRAICEHGQLWTIIENARAGADSAKRLSPDLAKWLRRASTSSAEFDYLSPAAMRQWNEYPQRAEFDLLLQRQACLRMVEARGWDLYLADFTRASIGLPVIRVMIPALRSMHRRLGPGRLYEVPIKIGRLQVAKTEAEMNSIDMFI